jgi:hypothetical protein
MTRVALFKTNTPNWIFMVLQYWNDSPRIDVSLHSGHIIPIPSQPVFALSCCVLSGEATNTNFIVFGLTRPGLEPTIYRILGQHADHYTTDAGETTMCTDAQQCQNIMQNVCDPIRMVYIICILK